VVVVLPFVAETKILPWGKVLASFEKASGWIFNKAIPGAEVPPPCLSMGERKAIAFPISRAKKYIT
jgi:hypothetical protein